MGKVDSDAIRKRAAGLLGDVEADLGRADKADDQIGAAATRAHDRLTQEISQGQASLDPFGDDVDGQNRWLYMLGQKRHAEQVRQLAEQARRRRGNGR